MNLIEFSEFDTELSAALFGLCARYNIPICPLTARPELATQETDVTKESVSPLDSTFGIVPVNGTCLGIRSEATLGDMDGFAMLHEMVHIILGPESLLVDEAFTLLSFETALVQDIAKRLFTGEAQALEHDMEESHAYYPLSLGTSKGPGKYPAYYKAETTQRRRLI